MYSVCINICLVASECVYTNKKVGGSYIWFSWHQRLSIAVGKVLKVLANEFLVLAHSLR